MAGARGRILIVDDEDMGSEALGFGSLAQVKLRSPQEVEMADLRWADLVLMDFHIEPERWPEREATSSIGLKAVNGLALAAVLREHSDTDPDQPDGHTAFAIFSGRTGELSRRFHAEAPSPHVAARLNNIEWVFRKGDESHFECAAALASGVRCASEWWQVNAPVDLMKVASGLLALSVDVDWAERAYDDVVTCQPPTSSLEAKASALLLIRWLLHGVLPYPTFLWDENWTAAALRITQASLREVVAGDSDLADDLRAAAYKGVLHDFLGARWWRGGVEQLAWSIRAEGARSGDAFHKALEERAGRALERIPHASPAVCIGADLSPTGAIVPIEQTVRLVPDLWPAFADAALADLDLVAATDALAAIVHPLDRDRLTERRIEDE